MKKICQALTFFVSSLLFTPYSIAAAPTSNDVDIYSSLCKIGSQTSVNAAGELGAIGRRILAGEIKLSASKLVDEFPGLQDEKNRLLALQSYQDCLYRYVEKFHSTPLSASGTSHTINPIDPAIQSERRREIVYLANELDNFKKKMEKVIKSIPEKIYDKRDSTEKKPKDDPRLVGLNTYERYQAFESATGGLNFSNLTNNDVTILCQIFRNEVRDYKYFTQSYGPLNLPRYDAPEEVARICSSASKGR